MFISMKSKYGPPTYRFFCNNGLFFATIFNVAKTKFLQQFCCKKMLQSFSAKTDCCKNILFKGITNNTKTNFCNILIFCNISVKCCKLFKKKKLLQTSMLQTFWENYQCCKSQLLQKKKPM